MSLSVSPPRAPVDSPRRGVRRRREPSPQTRSVRMRSLVQDMVGALNPELLTELTLAINRRLRDAFRRSPSPPPRARLPPPSSGTTETPPTTTRATSAATTQTSCGGLPPISSILPPPRGSPPPPPQLPAVGPPTPPTSPGVIRPQPVRARVRRSPPQRPANPPRIVRRNNGRIVTFVSTQPLPLMRTTASAFASSRRRAREGAVAGAPVSSSAERETQAVPSAPPMEQSQDSDSDSDRTISPAMSLPSTASTPPLDSVNAPSPTMFEDVYVDPDADREAWSSTPPPLYGPPAFLHLTCLPIWAERATGAPIIQDCLLCQEEGVHHTVRCRQCEQMSGCCCCSCIWKYHRSRYDCVGFYDVWTIFQPCNGGDH